MTHAVRGGPVAERERRVERGPVTYIGIALAVCVTFLAPQLLGKLSPADWNGWFIIQPFVVVAAWTAVWAWSRQRWMVASGCWLVTLLAPWGYFYPGPLVCLALSVVALVRAIRGRSRGLQGDGDMAGTNRRA